MASSPRHGSQLNRDRCIHLGVSPHQAELYRSDPSGGLDGLLARVTRAVVGNACGLLPLGYVTNPNNVKQHCATLTPLSTGKKLKRKRIIPVRKHEEISECLFTPSWCEFVQTLLHDNGSR
ncbi:hypothetical protein Bbelb_330710 [Branchiostoma belcheri]|nr:hypothetical protein Bbelb_369020 [Branchiostoma belcheri]KAI8489332.1 hypothetical protein Bbelb_330710 [Branchiostoma belcheri]